MKRVLTILAMLSIILLLAVLLMGCPGVPAVMTKDATDITSDSATLHGSISNISENDSISVHFRWKQYQGENEFSIEDHFFTPSITMISNTAFSSVITGLTPNTTYIFQAKCVSEIESTLNGEILTFTTSPEVLGEQEEEEEEPTGEQEEEDEEEEAESYNLTVTSSDGGSVISPSEGSHNYDEDEIVDLIAEADEGYQFDRWEGGVDDPTSANTAITMNAHESVVAHFIPIPLFELRSDDFNPEQAIPLIHSRWGGNVSPQLHWTDAPSDAVSFVLIMKDPVGWTGPCVHWIVFNIPADVTSLAEGASSNLPEGALQGTGDDAFGYYGCEPLSGQLHEYNFTIYALDKMLNLSQGVSEQQVLNAMEGHIIDQAVLVGTYQG